MKKELLFKSVFKAICIKINFLAIALKVYFHLSKRLIKWKKTEFIDYYASTGNPRAIEMQHEIKTGGKTKLHFVFSTQQYFKDNPQNKKLPIEKWIEAFRTNMYTIHDKESLCNIRYLFRKGFCYAFGLIIKEAYPEGEICLLWPNLHIVFKYKEKVYDINGNVFVNDTNVLIPFKEKYFDLEDKEFPSFEDLKIEFLHCGIENGVFDNYLIAVYKNYCKIENVSVDNELIKFWFFKRKEKSNDDKRTQN